MWPSIGHRGQGHLRLTELLNGAELNQATVLDDVTITGLTADSRAVRPGFLFAAIPGTRLDGRDHIDAAVRAGAAAVLAPPDVTEERVTPGISLITADNPRRSLARMAAAFYGEKPETIAAVTGTNGKTSVATFTRQIWNALGRKAASIGTLGIVGPGLEGGGGLTTPDPVELHRQLHELSQSGFQNIALEASSHGLDQFRLDGVPVHAAAFTNLTRDHLDYHGSMKEYRRAKMRLFRDLLVPGGAMVVNAEGYVYVEKEPGDYTLTQKDVGSRFALVAFRTGVNVQDPADVAKAQALQAKLSVQQAKTGEFVQPNQWDMDQMLALRAAYNKERDAKGIKSESLFGRPGVITPEQNNMGVAVGIGGLPKEGAVYLFYTPTSTESQTLTLRDVPNGDNAFWSLTVYDKDGFPVGNSFNMNSAFAKKSANGDVVINLGGDNQQENFLDIYPGWNATLRIYNPKASYFDGSWVRPELEQK